jgi:hypothetical protein
MPNWCNNSIEIGGDKKIISALKKSIEGCKDSGVDVFKTLIGIPDYMTGDEYDKDWYDTNIGWFGTKWDISYSEHSFNYEDELISFHCETAWSPPIEFLTNLVKQYDGIKAYIFYSEPGVSFSGQTNIYRDEDGRVCVDDEEYPYLEGLYKLDTDGFWSEVESYVDNVRDDITSQQDDVDEDEENESKIEEPLIREYVEEHFGFVTDKDKETIFTQLNEELNGN